MPSKKHMNGRDMGRLEPTPSLTPKLCHCRNFSTGAESISYQTSTSDIYYIEIYSAAYSTANYTLTVVLPSSGAWTKNTAFAISSTFLTLLVKE